MNKHTFLILRGTARAITYMLFASCVMLAPVMAGLLVGGDVSA